MAQIQRLGEDVAAYGDQWPLLPVNPGSMARVREARMGDIVDFPAGGYLLVPTGIGRYYRPMVVLGVFPLVWNYQSREFLMQENLPHLYASPLANCLIVAIVPDPGYAEREAAARQDRERRAASRRETNRRALQRAAERAAERQALERDATEKAADEQPVPAAPLSPASPVPASPVPAAAPLAAAPLAPAPLAPVLPAPVPVAPALVVPVGGAPNDHHQAGNSVLVEGSWPWWRQFVPDEIVDQWEQEEKAERQRIPIVVLE
ncbi:uncharacterized protein EAF01_002277 [Botrytis porri]|uniref:uncharacterized protein n=1 Tax=Botrytis porri TaxID=87229 RepID=UPI001900C681|nr:uncharacterized protein EAF01_002277 [Botrytis porri]KAF7910768.1 hypothetical protein EAF01_002277 [Botrytis porri]